MTCLPVAVRRAVIRRAHQCREYCLLHADYTTFAHEIDHVLPRKHGGSDSEDSLAYACAQCNRYKGSDVAAIDPETGEIVSLFNPRGALSMSSECIEPPTTRQALPGHWQPAECK